MTDQAPDPRTPLTPLEELLLASADRPGDAAALARFTEAVLDDMLGVPGSSQPDDPDTFTPVVLVDADGRQVAPAFTHPDRFAAFAASAGVDPASVQVLGSPARSLFERLVRANLPLVLNPNAGPGRELTVLEMSDLLRGQDPAARTRTVTEPTTLQVGRPAYVPEGLLDRLRAHLDGVVGAVVATLAWVEYPDGMQGYLLGVRGTCTREALADGLDRAMGDLGGRTLDVMVQGPVGPLPTDPVPTFWTGRRT